MEIPQEQVEALFDEYLRSPKLIEVGKIIEKRLGRKLRPFDIWYDGFKTRSLMPEEELSKQTRKLYPDTTAFEKGISDILMRLTWPKERAKALAEKIKVDAARGSGHAWGAAMHGEKSHLRTKIPATGYGLQRI